MIVLATQKGGSGKSTLARSIAAELAQHHRVAMLDLDSQGSLTKWWQRREADDLQLVTGLAKADQIAAAVAHDHTARKDHDLHGLANQAPGH